ncbi:hypothetical protein Misp03_54120 [Microbispora sp. NBRC 16548]|nr:hypothetical protein Misp03_54120 [Microbispora sp. NBRC 16548]
MWISTVSITVSIPVSIRGHPRTPRNHWMQRSLIHDEGATVREDPDRGGSAGRLSRRAAFALIEAGHADNDVPRPGSHPGDR